MKEAYIPYYTKEAAEHILHARDWIGVNTINSIQTKFLTLQVIKRKKERA
jgi:hypothetical protein